MQVRLGLEPAITKPKFELFPFARFNKVSWFSSHLIWVNTGELEISMLVIWLLLQRKSSSAILENNDNDVKFYEDCKLASKKSISNFIENTGLDIAKLNKRLQNTQKDKVYMLYKNNKFYHETMNNDDYEIVSYMKKPDMSKYIATAKNGKNMNILLRWKNGNGIAFPAFQIS